MINENTPPIANKKTALIVDDEILIIELVKFILEQHDFHVLTAKNGQEAIDVYDEYKEHINIVLLDIIMPILNGIEAFHALREERPDLKVIFISGYAEDDKVRECMKQGNVSFLQKPYKNKELVLRVKQVLEAE